jgi:hypothetical protein
MPSISLHNKDKRLIKISVLLTEGSPIISRDLLTKVELHEPWSITDGGKVTSFFYHLFSLFITLYILVIITESGDSRT